MAYDLTFIRWGTIVVGMKYYIYKIDLGVGKVHVKSTRHGLWHIRRHSGERKFEILETLLLPDELGCCRLKWIAHFLKQDYFLNNSLAEQNLSRRLFLDGEKRRHKGKSENLKKGKDADPFGLKDIPREVDKEEFSWGA
jgi:hypothetical protein